jgi:hypothetical protein
MQNGNRTLLPFSHFHKGFDRAGYGERMVKAMRTGCRLPHFKATVLWYRHRICLSLTVYHQNCCDKFSRACRVCEGLNA